MLPERADERLRRGTRCRPTVQAPGPDPACRTAAVCGMPALSRSSEAAPSARIGLQCRYWSFRNSSVRPSAARTLNGVGAVRQHDAVEERPTAPRPSARRPRSGLRSTDSAVPRRAPTNRGTAPAAVRRSAMVMQHAAFDAVGDEDRDTARADAAVARTGKQRQRRRLGDFRLDVGLEHLRHRRGQLAHAEARQPRPRPAPPRRSSSPETIRSRIAGVCTFDSSNRKALMMCVFSTGVWLFQNSVACV